jgi:hypothetical protein
MILLRVSLFVLHRIVAAEGQEKDFRCNPTPYWLSIHQNITQTLRMMQDGKNQEARERLTQISLSAFDDLERAFHCSLGISALFRALYLSFASDTSLHDTIQGGRHRAYKIALRFMHVAMNWLTHAFVINGSNSARWVDESSWPISLQQINEEESFIQKALDENGERGHSVAWQEAPTNFRDPNLRIAIVSVCDYPPDNPLPRLSRSNRELYAEKHGYQLIDTTERFDHTRPHAWAKITLLQRHILSNDYDWLLWFDCDTYFMNFTVTLDYLLYKYGSSELETGQRRLRPDFKMLIQEDHAMLNTGVFFIRTGSWSEDLLYKVYGPPDWPFIDHPWWENAAFSHVFLGSLASRMLKPDSHHYEQTDDMIDIYPVGVVVAPQYEFNSYHPITSRVFMHDNWEPGKFVLAFSGCKSGSSPKVVKMLYESYYTKMCELNDIQNKCISITDL